METSKDSCNSLWGQAPCSAPDMSAWAAVQEAILEFYKHLAPIMTLLLKLDMSLLDDRPSKTIANCNKV